MVDMKAQVVIIGSGIAGALAAYKLAMDGLSVLVVEAGPRLDAEEVRAQFEQSPHMHHNAGYPNEAHAPTASWLNSGGVLARHSSPLFIPEYLRCVGGTTWHWDGISHRFKENDFALKTTYGVGVDWPLTYEDLKPYYKEAEKELGVSGPQEEDYPMSPTPPSYLENWVQGKLEESPLRLSVCPIARNSQDYDGRSQCQGFSTCSFVCPSKARYTGVVHIEKAEEKGARVLDNTRADQIVVGADQKVSYVIARKPDGSSIEISGDCFILAANALESPRLLLHSASEAYPNGVANSSNLVGRNLMGHPSVNASYLVRDEVFPGRGPNIHFMVHRYRDTPSRTMEGGFMIHLSNAFKAYEEYHSHFLDKVYPPQLDGKIRENHSRKISFEACIEMLPNKENRVTLDPFEKDSAGVPKMRLHFSYSDYEKRSFASCKKVYQAMGEHLQALKTNIIDSSTIQSHLMGTLRMGHETTQSVTDKYGRCHDHPNLFVAGSSLFPTSTPVNPTLSIAALSLRMADHIKKIYGF